jgi:hypothetical protein
VEFEVFEIHGKLELRDWRLDNAGGSIQQTGRENKTHQQIKNEQTNDGSDSFIRFSIR